MRLDISVKTGGSYSSYLAYGTFGSDKFGDEVFNRKGYIGDPQKAPQGVKIERKGEGKYGSASHYYHYIIDVEEDFKFFIVEVGSGKQTSGDRKILFTPLEHRKESAQVEALENLFEQTAPIDSETIASLNDSLNLPDAIAPEVPQVPEQLELISVPKSDRREWIDPNLVNLSSGTQTRTESATKIEEYAEMMKADLWDWERSDIVIFESDEGSFPSDGHHRIKAAIASGVRIFAEVRKGSLRDAIWHSFASNKFHGLPLTSKDKNDRVRAILLDAEWQLMSDRAIAHHCGVSTPLVGKVRAELIASSAIAPTIKRKGKDGRSQASRKSKPVLVENQSDNFPLEPEAIAPNENLPLEPIAPIVEIATEIEKPVAIADNLIIAEEISVIHPHLEKETVRRIWDNRMSQLIHDLAQEGITWDECGAPDEYFEKKYKSGVKLSEFDSREALMIKEVAAILAMGEAWLDHPDWKGMEHFKAAQYFTAQPTFREMARTILKTRQLHAIAQVTEPIVETAIAPITTVTLEEEIQKLINQFGAKAVAEAALDECELDEIKKISYDLNNQLNALERENG